ncbi:unnamed protein product [marine sediment metagenome]|uniref:Ribosomal subunit interface protein n=1 Tax=marine sediment metagenome TaxID=412755 RepID=X0WUX9_9ZZZZ
METKFFAQNIKLDLRTKDLIRKKLEKVVRLAGYKEKDVRDIRVDLSRNLSHNADERIRLEVNINLYPGQKILRAAERAANLQNALDRVETILKRQVSKYKEKRKTKVLRGARFAKHIGLAAPEVHKEKPKYGQRRREE